MITSSIFSIAGKGFGFVLHGFRSLPCHTASELHPVKSSMAHRTIAMYETGFIGSTTFCFLSSIKKKARLPQSLASFIQYIPLGYNQLYSSLLMILAAS